MNGECGEDPRMRLRSMAIQAIGVASNPQIGDSVPIAKNHPTSITFIQVRPGDRNNLEHGHDGLRVTSWKCAVHNVAS